MFFARIVQSFVATPRASANGAYIQLRSRHGKRRPFVEWQSVTQGVCAGWGDFALAGGEKRPNLTPRPKSTTMRATKTAKALRDASPEWPALRLVA